MSNVVLGRALIAVFGRFLALAEQAIHRCDRAEHSAFSEQRRVNLARGGILETPGVQDIEDSLLL